MKNLLPLLLLGLVRRKVRAWVCMGGKMPEGREANLIHEGPAAAYAIANWPVSVKDEPAR